MGGGDAGGTPDAHPVDDVWLAGLFARRAATQPALVPGLSGVSAADTGSVERRQYWGEAPDVLGFVGRDVELAVLNDWVLRRGCRL